MLPTIGHHFSRNKLVPAAVGSILLEVIATLPQEGGTTHQTQHRPGKVKLDYRPYPETPQWRRLFHDGKIAVYVGDVNQVTASSHASCEEDGLAKGILKSSG